MDMDKIIVLINEEEDEQSQEFRVTRMSKDKFTVTVIGVDKSQEYCERKLGSIFRNSDYERECPPTTVGIPDPFLVVVTIGEIATNEWVWMILNCPVKLKASGLRIFTQTGNEAGASNDTTTTTTTLGYPSIKDGLYHASIVVGELEKIEGILTHHNWSAYIIKDVIYDVNYTMDPAIFSQSLDYLIPKVAGRVRIVGTIPEDGWVKLKQVIGNRNYNVTHYLIQPQFTLLPTLPILDQKKMSIVNGINQMFTSNAPFNVVEGVVIIGQNFSDLHNFALQYPTLNMYNMVNWPRTLYNSENFNNGVNKVVTAQIWQLQHLDVERNIRLINLDSNVTAVRHRILNHDEDQDDEEEENDDINHSYDD